MYNFFVCVLREVLTSAADHAVHFKTDSLQRLHALHNLHELLTSGHEGVPRALSDDDIPQLIADIKNKLASFVESLTVPLVNLWTGSEIDLECWS